MTQTFESLGISASRSQHLASMGLNTPTPIQAQAIPQLLVGHDVVAQAQTGTGKTAAFSLPILEKINKSANYVQALILAPTRELAIQVSQAMQKMSAIEKNPISVAALYGGQSMGLQIQLLRRGAQIVVGTPGRVKDMHSRGLLQLDKLSWCVLDEADEMLSMGFIEDVTTLLDAAPETCQKAFFSATMEPSIRRLVNNYLKNPVAVTVEQNKSAPKMIEQVAYMVPRGYPKIHALQPILAMENPESAIIFVRTRQVAAQLTNTLQEAGHSADEYHGNLTQEQRERLLIRFRQGQVRWVVATDIAARGLDVNGLSHVINFDLPDNVESYVHRIGRTGRAGRTGTAISLIHPIDRRKLYLIEGHIKQRLANRPLPTKEDVAARQRENLKKELEAKLTQGDMPQLLSPMVAQLVEKYGAHELAVGALQMVLDSYPVVDVPPLPPPEPARPAFASKAPGGRFRDGPGGFGPSRGKPKPWGAGGGGKKPYDAKGGSRFGPNPKGRSNPNRESGAER